MFRKRNQDPLFPVPCGSPDGEAVMHGGSENSAICGTVRFYRAAGGVLVVADLTGLPGSPDPCGDRIFAFHIHGGTQCGGDQFAQSGGHYDPRNCPHPDHAGDMPPLFSANGRAFLAFLTNRFTVDEILGKTVILHDRPDDFTSQPAGNAGKKIACGVIAKANCR